MIKRRNLIISAFRQLITFSCDRSFRFLAIFYQNFFENGNGQSFWAIISCRKTKNQDVIQIEHPRRRFANLRRSTQGELRWSSVERSELQVDEYGLRQHHEPDNNQCGETRFGKYLQRGGVPKLESKFIQDTEVNRSHFVLLVDFICS